jgi:ribosome-associated protein|tara:strand:- start:266 stop:637 length:372 start_codon:yes stop_codon:yes gene_type:complete
MAKKLDKTNILLKHIINVIQDAKGQEIISLDLRKIDSAICKYFIICTGTSSTHVNSIESKIKKTISQDLNEKPWHTEGNNVGEWVLMDYYDIIVHVFQKQTRKFYNIEDFWGDAKYKSYKEKE